MRRTLAAVAVLSLSCVVGCSHWSNDAKSRSDWYGDFNDCAQDASVIADYANGYVRGGIGIEFRLYPKVRPTLFRPFGKRIRENCMQDRGWRRQEAGTESSSD
ncbi:MAG TPA: hypothetical protein VII78_12095 [Myxococcota bacterium]|jgi:hypothetical protein